MHEFPLRWQALAVPGFETWGAAARVMSCVQISGPS